MPDQPPRRRITDNDRRRWNDKALDLLGDRVESHSEDIEDLRAEHRAVANLAPQMAAFRREFDEWKTERREDIAEFRTDIRELQTENRIAHGRLARGKDPVDGKELPPLPAKLSWGDVLKVATAVSLVLGPIAVIIAALLTGGPG